MSRILASTARCPYCSGKLPKAPTREHRCSSCNNIFYIVRGEDNLIYAVTRNEFDTKQKNTIEYKQSIKDDSKTQRYTERVTPIKNTGIAMAWSGALFGWIGQRLVPSFETLIIITTIALILSIVGCYLWSVGKRRSGWFSLFGILAPIGFIVIASLRDKND